MLTQMSGCCNPRGCERFFTPRFARRMARRYRKKGLDKTALAMVEFLESRGIEGATVLEVGGGIGEIQIELLRRGASHAVNLELSASYEDAANELLREANLHDRAERRLHDIAVDPSGVEPADVVVLHRVVCCYPDYQRLLGTAAGRARRVLVFSYPPRNILSRVVVGAETSCSACLVVSSGRSSIRRRRCSPWSSRVASARPSDTAASCGRWPAWSGRPPP